MRRDVTSQPAVLWLDGVIDEHSDVSFIRELHGEVAMHLDGLRLINSFGVRIWMAAVHALPGDVRLELHGCPPAFVDQINMLKGFLGPAKVASFLTTYACDRCGDEREVLIEVDRCVEAGYALPADVACARCRQPMVPDVIEEMFLRFLREPD